MYIRRRSKYKEDLHFDAFLNMMKFAHLSVETGKLRLFEKFREDSFLEAYRVHDYKSQSTWGPAHDIIIRTTFQNIHELVEEDRISVRFKLIRHAAVLVNAAGGHTYLDGELEETRSVPFR
jgi:hypothetical protein